MRLNRKRIWNLFGMTWFALVLAFGSYLMINDATVNKEKLDHYEGEIIETGVMEYESVTEYGVETSETFYIKLRDLDQVLAIYYTAQENEKFEKEIKQGDIVEVYYKASAKKNEPNFDVYQIKRAGQIMLNDVEFRGKRMMGGMIVALAAGLVIIIGIVRDRRHWKSRQRQQWS